MANNKKAVPVGGLTVHSRCKWAREKADLTHAQAAESMKHVSRQALHDYEQRVWPGGWAVAQMCLVYGITSDWLLGIPPVGQRP